MPKPNSTRERNNYYWSLGVRMQQCHETDSIGLVQASKNPLGNAAGLGNAKQSNNPCLSSGGIPPPTAPRNDTVSDAKKRDCQNERCLSMIQVMFPAKQLSKLFKSSNE